MVEQDQDDNRSFLVGISGPEIGSREAEALLDELQALVATIGLETVDRQTVRVREISPRYYLGSGKAEELAQAARDAGADVIVFDEELSPAQQRNWEQLSKLSVTDRQGIILEIFADRAQTHEAHLQVELAQMEYFLPRLTSAWSHLSRQRGGRRGTRGEGETQLEVDRRIVLRRIASLKRELSGVRNGRAIMRKQRLASTTPNGSIVGYTNAGKSSLLQALTGARVEVANKLFATLDPATRRLELDGGQGVLLTDTVGFIRRLPHGLVEAFKSTLEETVISDFLIHVMDASDAAIHRHAQVTREVLAEIGGANTPTIQVLNKSDLVAPDYLEMLRLEFPEAIGVSARTGNGMDALRDRVREVITLNFSRVAVSLPHDRYDLAALIHRTGHVVHEDYEGNGIRIDADVPERTRQKLVGFTITGPTRAEGESE
ncbi:MAG: GTPase HflX [Spirochaetales bacterium]|nr:GTPase HflX [Spirochaetales bacterium]